jgi:hypothetical protein
MAEGFAMTRRNIASQKLGPEPADDELELLARSWLTVADAWRSDAGSVCQGYAGDACRDGFHLPAMNARGSGCDEEVGQGLCVPFLGSTRLGYRDVRVCRGRTE